MEINVSEGPSSFILGKKSLPFSLTLCGPSFYKVFSVTFLNRCEKKGGGWEMEGKGKMKPDEDLLDFSSFYNSETKTGTISIEI